jgi:ADP-heptose:LPS heptosyltransferase
LSAVKVEIEISKNVQCIAGRFSFQEELNIISHLDLMCSMDSANMHLASLYNVPVVSIWGATHPFAGFYGWGQSPQNIVSIDLACRLGDNKAGFLCVRHNNSDGGCVHFAVFRSCCGGAVPVV